LANLFKHGKVASDSHIGLAMHASSGRIDAASDILAAARAAQRNATSLRDEISKRRSEGAMLAAKLAEFEATLNKILDRQRDLEERQDKVEQQAATMLSALLMVQKI